MYQSKISKRKEVRYVTLRFLFGWLPFLCRPVTDSFPQFVVDAMELETSIPILLFVTADSSHCCSSEPHKKRAPKMGLPFQDWAWGALRGMIMVTC
ncbi:unnamed protein product [Cuscuta campestris]|uniref:Uncharacterized protein n=1 Tax=Cuscuta campestris TaxID=132261 RepID=A0A484NCP9_9ASTE|nr:unnamed protein product [Cuscuta campestris]